MALEEIRTFLDVQDAILRRGKLTDNEATRADLREKINTIYQRIGFEERYSWSGATMPLRLRGSYTTGTITATNGSDELTGASTVWVENTHRFHKIHIAGSNVPYTLLNIHSTTTATMSAPFVGTTASSLAYTLYKDEYGLFPDFHSLRKLRIPGVSPHFQPVPTSPEEMDQLRDTAPFRSGIPRKYTIYGNAIYTEKVMSEWNPDTDFWEDSLDSVPRQRALIVWPAINTTDRTMLIRYTRVLPPMVLDTEEPLIPYGHREVIVYGVLEEYFLQKRDLVTARAWGKKFEDLKKRMAGDIETIDDEVVLHYDRTGLSRASSLVDYDDIRET